MQIPHLPCSGSEGGAEFIVCGREQHSAASPLLADDLLVGLRAGCPRPPPCGLCCKGAAAAPCCELELGDGATATLAVCGLPGAITPASGLDPDTGPA